MARRQKPRVDLVVDGGALERGGLWESIADWLRESIVTGKIPTGASLVEGDLAERFQVSRGPIREALRELAREGLVVDLPRRGATVSTPSVIDLQEVLATREGIEIVASRLAIERATDSQLTSLADRLTAINEAWANGADWDQRYVSDLDFHRNLVALSQNGRLIAIYEQMLSQMQMLMRSAAMLNPKLARGTNNAAHSATVKALIARDETAAWKAIRRHYAYSAAKLIAGYTTDGRPHDTGP